MATESIDSHGLSTPGAVDTIQSPAADMRLNAPAACGKTIGLKIKRLSFVLRWLGVFFAACIFFALMRLAEVGLSRGMPLALYLIAKVACSIYGLGVLFLFVRYAVVPRLRDIGCYGPFIWIVTVLAFVLPLSGVVWFLLGVTPSNFIRHPD